MSLGSSLDVANRSLRSTSMRTGVLSQNITNADNENYSRRVATTESTGPGARGVVLRTNVDSQLTTAHLDATAESEAQKLIADRLDQLNITLNGLDGSRSPSARLTELHNSLQVYTANPSSTSFANSAIENARSFADSLNDASTTLNNFRRSADADIAQEVSKLNNLLQDFHRANQEVVTGSRLNRDVNDALDQRDMALKEINKIVPVNITKREGHDYVLVTKDGGTLYEAIPRQVTFEQISIYNSYVEGNPVRIDGVPVEGGRGANSDSGGSLSALIQLRDSTVSTLQTQLDEIARGAITAFAETDATNTGQPDMVGLFTYPGAPAVPADGVHIAGLASEIQVNAAFDPSQGGNPQLLRDGGANGANYIHNTSSAASFSTHLISLVQSLDVNNTYSNDTGVGGSMSVLTFASNSIGWIEGQRSEATQSSLSKGALSARLAEKISNESGVNIDEEMSLLLRLEHSYQASARIITTVDEMLTTLMNMVR